MRAAIYLRQSKLRPGSVSIEMQEQVCREYAARMAWAITGIYIDRGESGSNGRSPLRPQYRAMLAAADTWDVVLVWRLDRNGRHELEFHRMLADIEERGKTFAAATEDVDDPLVRSIKIAIAADVARKIGQAASSARRTKARRGLWPQAPPWGTVKDGDVLRPDPDRAWIIREALHRLATGQSLASVITWVNTGPLAASPVSRNLIVRWVTSPALRGEVLWEGVTAPAAWEPIVDPAIQREAARRLRERYHVRPTPDYSAQVWLRGFERCALCGSRMRVNSTTKPYGFYIYLACIQYAKGRAQAGCPASRYHSCRKVEAEALCQIRAMVDDGIADPEMVRRVVARTEAEREDNPAALRQRIEADLAMWEGWRDRAKQGYLSGVLTDEEARDERQKAEHELARCRAELDVLAGDTDGRLDADALGAFLGSARWLELAEIDPPAFRDALRAVVRTILIPDDRGNRACRVVWVWEG